MESDPNQPGQLGSPYVSIPFSAEMYQADRAPSLQGKLCIKRKGLLNAR
jgi:hypothetical protein